MRKTGLARALALLWAVTVAAAAQADTVTGSVTWRDRMAVPQGAVLDVQLLDVSRMDVAAVPLSQMRHALDRMPFAFELAYDPALIDDRMTYAVQARVLVGDQVLYRSTTGYPVLTRGAGDRVEITVERMPQPAAAADNPLAGSWEVIDMHGRLMVGDKRPGIEFQADGSFAADSTCNRYVGTAEIGDGTVTFPEAMAGTRMACPDPYGTIERDFVAALALVRGYVVNEAGGVALTNEAGMAVLRLIPNS